MPIPSLNRPPEEAQAPKPTSPRSKSSSAKPKAQEEKNLVVIHGMNRGNLRKVGETGLAMPSLGIVNKKFSNIGFGDVTLIAHPSHVNPKTTPVYDRDAFTPRWSKNLEIVKTGKPNPKKWEAFKQEAHGATDRYLDKVKTDAPQLRKYAHDSVDRGLKNLEGPFLRSKSSDDFSPYDFVGNIPEYVLPEIEGKLTPGYQRAQFWRSRIEDLFDTKTHVQDTDTGKWRVELTPENEKEILNKMRGKGTIKAAEYGGMKDVLRQDKDVALDTAVARRLGSYASIKQEAEKKLLGKEAPEVRWPKDLGDYDKSQLKSLVFESLRQGKTVSQYIANNKDFGNDEKERIRVGAVLDQYVKDKKEQKQSYFEAKPQKFFRLGDFRAAVVPSTILDEYKDLFAQHGVDVLPYENSADRAEKIRELATKHGLFLSEKDLGLEQLIKNDLLEEVEAELALEELKKSEEQDAGEEAAPVAKESVSEPKCVLTIITDGMGKMLFIKRNDNHKWSVCAGHLEDGEDPEEGARREILEETGLEPTYLSRIYESKNPNLVCFSAQCQGIPNGRNDPDQEGSPQWVYVGNGVPSNIYDHLAGPDGNVNVVRQLFQKEFQLKKSEYNWLFECGMTDLSK